MGKDLSLTMGNETFTKVLEVKSTHTDRANIVVSNSFHPKDAEIIRTTSNGTNNDLVSYTLF